MIAIAEAREYYVTPSDQYLYEGVLYDAIKLRPGASTGVAVKSGVYSSIAPAAHQEDLDLVGQYRDLQAAINRAVSKPDHHVSRLAQILRNPVPLALGKSTARKRICEHEPLLASTFHH